MSENNVPTQAEIYQIEKDLQEKKRKLAEANRKQKMENERKFIESKKVNVYWSDDYYWASWWEYSFYYWYERTMCKIHQNTEDCDRFECDERERCFTVERWKEEIMRIPTSDLKNWNIEETFISWIMIFIQTL